MKIHMVGGFLGSGKTTAIISAAKAYMKQGLTVGVITNDQGKYLVDTNFMRLEDIPAVEVNGGCFCCNYADFDESLDKLAAQLKPDVVFAESVGSCADVVATVMQPLLQYKKKDAEELSLSVFTDARLLGAYLNGVDLPFQDSVMYVFEKQIEEADLLIINKIDLLNAEQRESLINTAQEKYPDKIIIAQSSLTPEDVKPWLKWLEKDHDHSQKKQPLSINYQVYGAGEQELAWYDGVYELRGKPEQLVVWVNLFIKTLNKTIIEKQIPVGHLKFLVSDSKQHQKISITGTSEAEDLQGIIGDDWQSTLVLLINARLEYPQQEIVQLIHSSLDAMPNYESVTFIIKDEEAFHPGFPAPTHRLV